MLRTNSLPKNASHHVKGISHFPINNGHGGEDFCHPDTFNGLKQIGASIIRIPVGVEIGDGFIHQPDQVIQRVESAVDTAINQGFPVIICWHTDKAEQYTQHAIKFFRILLIATKATPT